MKRTSIVVASVFIAAMAQAALVDYQSTISAPTDGGAGPALWYQTSRTPNSGSAAASHVLTSGGTLTSLSADYWGNANSAFGPEAATTSAGAVAGSTGLFASGANGTVSFMFKTPGTLGTDALFSQGENSHTSQFELMIVGGKLRMGVMFNGTKINNTFGASLSPDTWYYYAMNWDLTPTYNGLRWHYGEAGDATLNTGTVSLSVSGASDKPIQVGGRVAGYVPNEGSFQNIAVYERTLSDSAIQSQFAAIPEPAVMGMITLSAGSLLFIRRLFAM